MNQNENEVATEQPARQDAAYAELRALAEKATPGPWRATVGTGATEVRADREAPPHTRIARCLVNDSDYIRSQGDAAYIAAANPAAILALLADNDRLAERVAVLEAALNQARNMAHEEAAELLDSINDPAGDCAAYDNREMHCCETERMQAITMCAEKIRALAVATPHPHADEAAKGWICVVDQIPPKGESVLIYYPLDTAEPWRIDMWDEWHEDPIGMGGATICTGEGWMCFGDEEITHWMPLPAPPSPAEGKSA